MMNMYEYGRRYGVTCRLIGARERKTHIMTYGNATFCGLHNMELQPHVHLSGERLCKECSRRYGISSRVLFERFAGI